MGGPARIRRSSAGRNAEEEAADADRGGAGEQDGADGPGRRDEEESFRGFASTR